jgi:curved DNA-binding protein CbpA
MAERAQNSGLLTETPPVRVFLEAEGSTFSGVLALTNQNEKRLFLFENGKPVSARSNLEEEYLGSLLVAEKIISKDQSDEVLRLLKEQPGKHFGELLLTVGFVDPATLMNFLQDQLKLRFHRVLTWREGRFVFAPQALATDTPKVNIEDPVTSICFRGLLKNYSEHPQEDTSPSKLVPVLIGGQVADVSNLKLSSKEMSFFRSMSGVSSLDTILAKTKIDGLSARAILYSLQDMGMVRLDIKEEKKEEVTRPNFSNMILDLIQRAKAMGTQNHFELLGLTNTATADQIKKSYLDFARRYHPDRLPKDIPQEHRKSAEDLFARATQAHSILSNSQTRKDYENTLKAEAAGVTQETVNNVVESELEFQKGLAHLRKANPDGAAESFQRAIKLYDKEPQYYVYLGWAMFRSKGKTPEEIGKARQCIEHGLKMDRSFAEGFYFLGMISKSENSSEKAKKFFSHAVSLNPKHHQASSELHVINMREEKMRTSLSGLFRKTKF